MIKTALENKLNALKIAGTVSSISDNAFFTIYRVMFNADITINKIKARRGDLELFFGGSAVDIETDGGDVLIKVAKQSRGVIGVYDFTCDVVNGIQGQTLPLIIGQKEDGTRLYYDLCKMPHMLIAGSTGSGKSVFLHNCILSTIYSAKSSLVLIDVKRVEFAIYENLPHLAAPICYDASTAAATLKKLCDVMSIRYEELKNSKCRNIQELHERGGDLQYITVFIDELADLILNNKRVEQYIIRLAQLGRAAGIHLIVATQRPDAQILSGLIRINIPTRVCFAVQKSTDSRIILDMNGGEKLRGAGDGLFYPIGAQTATRFQCPYITTQGLEKVVEIARHCND